MGLAETQDSDLEQKKFQRMGEVNAQALVYKNIRDELDTGGPIGLVGPEKMMDYGELCKQNHRAKNMLDSRNKILTSNLFGKNFSLVGNLKDKINRVLSGYLKKQEA
jgi:hypothetical protein